jgi:heterodisulfide reductase subunit A
MTDVRLGVFICDCRDQISSILDMDTLEREVRDLEGVAITRRLCRCCSPDGLSAIQSAIAEIRLNRLLVAGCTPRTMGPRFRAACEEAGLDGNLFEMVDIREGCAWVHQDDAEAATAKAVDLIRMGVARGALRQAYRPVSAEAVPAALVIGGGLAGMTSALTLADAGVPVKLVEREVALGGMLRDVNTLYPDQRSAAELVAEMVEAITHHPRIEVLCESRVTGVLGTVGHYAVTTNGNGAAGPQKRSSKFDVGAIIVATGAYALQPRGLFRYDGQRVVTQLEFERELRETSNEAQAINVSPNIIMILCAGQRNQDVSYCSGVCCMGALKQAIEVKTINPQATVTILFRDLYLLGEDIYEEQVRRARQAGVTFIRYAPEALPEVTKDAVEVHDELTGMDRRLPYDRIVLASPLVPQPDASVVAHMLKIRQDDNGFFPEVRYRLRPQDYADRGIYVCGAAHCPTGWIETEFQAISAAFRALHHLTAGRLTNQAPVASVDENLCTGCGSCVEMCTFGAISMHRQKGVLHFSQIDPLLCTGCGNCVVACPVKAISLPLNSDRQILAQIEVALTGASQRDCLRILALGCEWSCHAAAELAGGNRLSYPVEVRLIQVGCSTRFDPRHILWAFFNGADGVFLGACPPGDCHYVNGNSYAQQRIGALKGMLAQSGFDPRRVCLEWITPDDPHDFVDKITDFTNLVRALGPSPACSD